MYQINSTRIAHIIVAFILVVKEKWDHHRISNLMEKVLLMARYRINKKLGLDIEESMFLKVPSKERQKEIRKIKSLANNQGFDLNFDWSID